MAEGQPRSRFRTPTGSPLLREVPVGTKLLLKDQVRYLETSSEDAAVGDEEWVFYTDVQDFAQEM